MVGLKPLGKTIAVIGIIDLNSRDGGIKTQDVADAVAGLVFI